MPAAHINDKNNVSPYVGGLPGWNKVQGTCKVVIREPKVMLNDLRKYINNIAFQFAY